MKLLLLCCPVEWMRKCLKSGLRVVTANLCPVIDSQEKMTPSKSQGRNKYKETIQSETEQQRVDTWTLSLDK